MFVRFFPCFSEIKSKSKIRLPAACSEMGLGGGGRLGGSKGTRQESTRPRSSGIKQQGGLHGSAVTGQHPPLYGGRGVPVPALFCNLREYKHGQTEVSRQRAKAEAVWMLSGAYEGEATVCCY